MSESAYQRLRSHLAYLGLTIAADRLAHHLDDPHASTTEVLEPLLQEEVTATEKRRAAGRLRFAHYPLTKTLGDFDFSFQPTIDGNVVAELSTLRFVEEKRSFCCSAHRVSARRILRSRSASPPPRPLIAPISRRHRISCDTSPWRILRDGGHRSCGPTPGPRSS
jgi:hypothetical protein